MADRTSLRNHPKASLSRPPVRPLVQKIRGKLRFFGRWGRKQGKAAVRIDNLEESASETLEQFNREWSYLKDGRTSGGLRQPPPDDR